MSARAQTPDDEPPGSQDPFDYPRTVDQLFERLGDGARRSVLSFREQLIPTFFPGVYVDRTILKLACLIFPKVAITGLTAAELQHLHWPLSDQRGERGSAAEPAGVRKILRRAEWFQEETAVLREHDVLTPLEIFDGYACMFQPAIFSMAG